MVSVLSIASQPLLQTCFSHGPSVNVAKTHCCANHDMHFLEGSWCLAIRVGCWHFVVICSKECNFNPFNSTQQFDCHSSRRCASTALDLKLVVEAQKEAYEKAEIVKRLREKMAKKEATGSMHSSEYQRFCGDELGLLVLATKNSDSETTVKVIPDVATTPKAMAKSNDPKVREAAALMEAEASSRSKSLSAPPSPIHRPKLPTPPRPPFLPASRDFRSPGREFYPESVRLIDWETSNDIQKAPC